MGKLSFLLAIGLSASLASWADVSTKKVGDFALLDHKGNFHQLRKYSDSKAVVIISLATHCVDNIEQLAKYRLLRTTWERQGVSFLAIDSSVKDGIKEIRAMDQTYNLDLPILLDDAQLVAESLGIKKAGEIVVLEPNQSQILYRGGLDIEPSVANPERKISVNEGASYLSDTLSKVISDEWDLVDTLVETEALGCALDFPSFKLHSEKTPDYATDVVPVLKEKCVGCHVEGGIAPFAMDSHMMVKGWSSMIKEVVMTKRMPPAQVDPSINHFTNARHIDVSEQQTLIHWIDAGAPRGESIVDPLTNLKARETIWDLGEPDYVVEVPAFKVPATGVLDYEIVTINLPFEKDMWVKSVQHVPGERRALHHLLSYIVPAKQEDGIEDESDNFIYREFLEGYAPGKERSISYPEDSGVFVPVGSAIQMSLHYTTYGKETVDRTLLGLYFAEEEPKFRYSTYPLSHGGTNIVIPPLIKEHKMSASYVFDEEIVLHGLRPHMHYRGKYMRMSVVYPGGAREEIINVPNYSFAWQPTYRLAEPMLLPAGSRVVIDGAFDNSHHNLGNPDPDALVRGGAQSWDEMFIGYFSYHKTSP